MLFDLAIFAIPFFILVLSGVSIPLGLGIATFSGVWFAGFPISAAFHRVFGAIGLSFPLLAVPPFVFTGVILSKSSLMDRIVDVANIFVGNLRGGLGLVNIMASFLFGGVSGSASADTSAIGAMLIPPMEKAGYDREYASAITVASSALGPIVPPSINMIVMAWVTDVSIAALFLAGYVPGISIVIVLSLMNIYISHKKGYPKNPIDFGIKQAFIRIIKSLPALFAPFLIIGGIVTGIFTATEAGAMAVLYVIIVMGFYGELTIKRIYDSALESVVITGIVALLIGFANAVIWYLARTRIPYIMVEEIIELGLGANQFLVFVVILSIFMGMFITPMTVMLIAVPLLFPTAQQLGIEPLHFAIVAQVAMTFGNITPPVGVCLYIVTGIADVEVSKLIKALIPFLIALSLLILFLIFVPDLLLFLPRLFNYI